MQNQSFIQGLSFNNRNKLVWTGSYGALQQFVQEVLDMSEGSWTSPGTDSICSQRKRHRNKMVREISNYLCQR